MKYICMYLISNIVYFHRLESRWEMDFFEYALKYFLGNFTEEEMIEQKSPDFVKSLNEADTSYQYMVKEKRKAAKKMKIKCKLWGDFPEDVDQGQHSREMCSYFGAPGFNDAQNNKKNIYIYISKLKIDIKLIIDVCRYISSLLVLG